MRLAGRQFHNQPPGSPLDRWLTALWDAVRADTGGGLDVRVCPRNDGIAGGDPQALDMLVAGEIQFFTVMGGLLGSVHPVAEIQNVPFAFRGHAHVFAAVDGVLGDHLRGELRARGVYMVPRACLENGFRHVTTSTRPIRSAEDLEGLRIRTPAGRIFVDFFETLDARPRPVNLDRLHDALATGAVEAQENPLVMVDVHRVWEVQRHLSLTGHIWSGFNLVAHAGTWFALPESVRAAVEHHAARVAALQRAATDAENAALAARLAARGLAVNRADTESFRRRLGPFYARWRREFGARAWRLLEDAAGPVG